MDVVEAVKHLFIDSGAGWVLWALFALSMASVAVVVERAWVFRHETTDVIALAARLDGWLAAGEVGPAAEALARERSLAAAIACAGLRLGHLGPEAAEKAMRSAVAVHRKRLERGLAYLGTLGNNAPFVGLFGTVIGVIQAFEELGHGAPGHGGTASAASQIASQSVMTGIAEALVATAVGIAVALPAVAAYNLFQRRIAALLLDAEATTNLVLAYLAPRKGEG